MTVRVGTLTMDRMRREMKISISMRLRSAKRFLKLFFSKSKHKITIKSISIQALPISSCLFCHKESSSLESSLDHMKTRHDFVIPDRQFCIDEEGLMEYLCLKVRMSVSRSTLWCIAGGSRSYVCVLSREKSGIPYNRCSSTTYGGEAAL